MSQSSGDERNIFAEITNAPQYADERNFYKLETWSKDGMHLTGMLHAGKQTSNGVRSFAPSQPSGPERD